jgi:predicted permease
VLVRILEIVFPIIAIVVIGVIYGRARRTDMQMANQVNLHVFIPCLVFSALIRQPLDAVADTELLFAAFLMHLLPALLVLPIIRLSGHPVKTLLPPAIFANAGNLGLPLFVLAFGEVALAPAVVLFLVMNIMQFTAGVRLLDREIRWRRVLLQPVLLAAVVGVVYQMSEMNVSSSWLLPLEMLGQVAVPLMLFSLGTSLAHAQFIDWRLGLWFGMVIPIIGIIAALLVIQVIPLEDLQQRMLVLYGALPPAVMTFIFAQRYNQEPGKVATVVMIGNILAVLVIPVTLYFVLSA